MINIGPLNLEQLEEPTVAVVQLRTQPPGVIHQVMLRPDKVKQTMRQCSLGHAHRSAVIMVGETQGDQASGWQFPENVLVVAVLGKGVCQGDAASQETPWDCVPFE